jgi:hypothetical protein
MAFQTVIIKVIGKPKANIKAVCKGIFGVGH